MHEPYFLQATHSYQHKLQSLPYSWTPYLIFEPTLLHPAPPWALPFPSPGRRFLLVPHTFQAASLPIDSEIQGCVRYLEPQRYMSDPLETHGNWHTHTQTRTNALLVTCQEILAATERPKLRLATWWCWWKNCSEADRLHIHFTFFLSVLGHLFWSLGNLANELFLLFFHSH